MKLSKQQKVYTAVLVFVLGALVIDRAYLSRSNPTKAQAETSESSNKMSGEDVSEANAIIDSVSQSPTMKLVQQLDTLWSERNLDLSQARDAFSLPESWLVAINPNFIKGTRAEDYNQGAETSFAKNHQLKAVVVQGRTRCVMVDDHFLVIGQELDGFKLIEVDEDSATFQAGAKRVVLRLANDR
jgi:hypothetical protein